MKFDKMMAMGLRSLNHAITGARCPTNVMLAVTNRCNSHCRYCNIPTRDHRDMTTAEIFRLIDEMWKQGTKRLGIWGGEPLLRDDIGQIISHAHDIGMYVSVDTNGILLREKVGVLKKLDHLVISMDGNKAGHEANRGAGTFARVMDALELASEIKGLKVWSLTVLTKENLQDIDFILDTARRLKIYAAFQVLHHSDELGRNHETMIPTDDEYREAIRKLIQRKQQGARISSSFRYLNYLLKWESYVTRSRKKAHLSLRCKAGALYCNIDADGKVYACSLLVGREPAKNALEVGFKKAFEAIPEVPCQACTAACYTEYNYLHALDPACILEWIRTTRD